MKHIIMIRLFTDGDLDWIHSLGVLSRATKLYMQNRRQSPLGTGIGVL